MKLPVPRNIDVFEWQQKQQQQQHSKQAGRKELIRRTYIYINVSGRRVPLPTAGVVELIVVKKNRQAPAKRKKKKENAHTRKRVVISAVVLRSSSCRLHFEKERRKSAESVFLKTHKQTNLLQLYIHT